MSIMNVKMILKEKLEKKEYVKCTDRNRFNDCSLFLKAKRSEERIKRFIEYRERSLFGV